jgi:hypothetical protein
LILIIDCLQYCTLGRLSHEVGWKYQDVVATLEAKRKIKASVAYGKKKQLKASIPFNLVLLNCNWKYDENLTPHEEKLMILILHALPAEVHEIKLLIFYLQYFWNAHLQFDIAGCQENRYQGCGCPDRSAPESGPFPGIQVKITSFILVDLWGYWVQNTPMAILHLKFFLH